MALSENSTVEELKELAAKYGDLEVTRDDSLNAGKCEEGTDDFIEEFLNGRTTIKVSDLAEYIDDSFGVRAVLVYRFSLIAEESEAKSEDTSEGK